MRNWKKIVGMLLIMAVWLGLMWRLSTENGTETLKDSMRFARKFGAWIYGEPTAAQLDHLNLVLRKMAHVFLYAVFGGMLAVFWQLLLRHKVWRILGAIGCSTAIAFLDELQKIPIAGRHFDASESMLNAVSAAVVIFRYCPVCFPLETKSAGGKNTVKYSTRFSGIPESVCFFLVKIFKIYLIFNRLFCII